MTLEERMLWGAVRNNRLDGIHFRRQQIIAGYIADFYCEAASLVIELDGIGHEFTIEEDAFRDRVLSEFGIKVIRISNVEIRQNLDAIVRRIRRHVHR